MGGILLVARLAVRNVRRRPVEALLLLMAMTAATTTLTLGLALHGVTDDPYQGTREATKGPDVVATVAPTWVDRNKATPADLSALEPLPDAPGVVDHSGPYPATATELEVDGLSAGVWAVGRDAADVGVDQPELTEGGWVEDGGAVIEAAFADVLGVSVGDQVTLGGRSFPVVGVAVTAASSYTDVCFGWECGFSFGSPPPGTFEGGPPVPVDGPTVTVEESPEDPGLVWLTQADVLDLAPSEGALAYVLNLKLADPADASAFIAANTPTDGTSSFLASWTDIRYTYGEFVRGAQQALGVFGTLLALLATASVAVLVGGRMADQVRRVGLLKAVGGTPGRVALVLLAEYVVLAVLAAAAGLAVGWLVTPALADPGAGLLGSAGAPSLTWSTTGIVTAVALGVAVVASLVPALRASRISTVDALADAARRPRRARWLTPLSARLPVPLLLGVRVAARRPRRVLLGVVSIAVTVSGIVVVLAGHAAMAADWEGASRLDPEADRANQVLLVISVILVALAAINAVFITWATVLDARHSSALARALGATPSQVSAGLSAAQILPALVGASLGIPGGLALFSTLSNDEAPTPPSWQLVAVVALTVLLVAVLTTIPARFGGRRPVSPVLQAEIA
jgi:ABC-type lipoprotein release transport system permease subunit